MFHRLLKVFIGGMLTAVLANAEAYAGTQTDTIANKRLNEIVVTGNSARERISQVRLGAEHLELSRLSDVPSFAGEKDIIKSIALLPGVRSEGDGAGGFEVRGGNSSQNLIQLDGITLYNPAHVMGIFSTFNDDALGSATIFKGPIPASFGNASSAVLETSLAHGNMEHYHGLASIGILSARFKAEGPIVSDKLSFAVTGRRSYVDAFLKMVPKYRSTIMNFYDVTAKLRFTPSNSQIIDGSFFISRDNMAISRIMGMYWGNLGASVRWVVSKGDNLTFTTSSAITHYTPKMTMDMMDADRTLRTFIKNYSLSEKIRWMITDSHSIEFGLRSELLRVKSAEWTQNAYAEREVRSLLDNALWVDYIGSISQKLHVSAGLRVEIPSALSSSQWHEFTSLVTDEAARFNHKTYLSVEPRISLKYDLTPRHNVKTGAGVSTQNLHAIRANSTSFPFDRFALTSAYVKPERSMQFSAGYAGISSGGDYDWSMECYMRRINDVYDFKDGKGIFSDVALENIILGGTGRSCGAEFMIRKNTGRFTGWIAYSISKTQTKISGINDGRWFDATNDRRHDLSVTAVYRINERWNVAGAWIYMSGQALTVPDVKYEIGGATCYYYSRRNGYRTPSTNRLDLSAKYIHSGKRFTYEWAFGVYNAYCRYNPYIVYFTDDPMKPSGTKAVLQALFGVVPSVSYTLKF